MTESNPAQPSIKRLLKGLDQWFHPPADPQIASLFRIAVGALVFINFVATAPYVGFWWSEHGVLPLKAAKLIREVGAWSLFDWLPQTDAALWTCWSIAVKSGSREGSGDSPVRGFPDRVAPVWVAFGNGALARALIGCISVRVSVHRGKASLRGRCKAALRRGAHQARTRCG